jgi:hypothetical protein
MIWRALLSIAFLLIAVPAFLASASSAPPSETEAQLLARIQKEHDPVRKSKEKTRLARIKLQQVVQTYQQGNAEQGAQLISAYLDSIKDSWEVLRSSKRDAVRAPQGFRELDIELREDERMLDDLKRRVSYFDRDPIEKAAKEVDQVRTEVLHALFPEARVPEAAKPLRKTD